MVTVTFDANYANKLEKSIHDILCKRCDMFLPIFLAFRQLEMQLKAFQSNSKSVSKFQF